MDNPDIRMANERERDQAAELLAGSEPWITLGITAEKCRKTCHDPELMVYIAFADQSPAGVIILDPQGVAGSPYIKSVAVYPAFRSKGIGAALLSFAEEKFRDRCRFIFLCVSSFNTRAQKFYERCGYAVTGELKDYLLDGKSEILMVKRL